MTQLSQYSPMQQRRVYLLAELQLDGKSLSREAFREITDELAQIDNALQRYGGDPEDASMDDIADVRREARFGCGL